jgi:2-phospho-L-lactate guanylyltransferase
MTRLAASLSDAARRSLAQELAGRVVRAGLEADLEVVVVTADEDVAAFMHRLDVNVWEDQGNDLSQAATGAIAKIPRDSWVVAHADLPLISPGALRSVDQRLVTDTVLVPSSDGGTNVIGSKGMFPFSYGTGSFQRHFASVPSAIVVTDPRLAIDVDLPAHLSAVDLASSTTLER